ncbi:acyltransferase [Tenacibaculum sp. C7A-26P2]|uniref:acyltransferase n=1 Tax=Tenacibaculum sp. C7A-26P2 TaxID=3447504 RepID=UPI003F867507
MIHKSSEINSKKIGEGTKIWQFCVILEGAVIGNNCNICSHCFVENKVTIGNNVTVKSGVQIWDGITIEDDVFIGANVSFTNDKYPKSRNNNFSLENTLIRKGAVIGAGATILPGLEIGNNSTIGAGSVLTKNVGNQEVWFGNPAKLMGYKCLCGKKTDRTLTCYNCKEKK